MTRATLAAMIAAALVLPAAQAPAPAAFRTAARFAAGDNELALTSAVAISEPHPRFPGVSWVHVYFYAFPFAVEDVDAALNGRVRQLDAKQQRVAPPQARNSSRAVVHLLVEQDATVSNVTLELPGVTCTIAETSAEARAAFPDYTFDARAGRARLRGNGVFTCDLQSVGMGKPVLRWDVNAGVPLVARR